MSVPSVQDLFQPTMDAFELDAAPITLIDGDRLLGLLMERQIVMRKEAEA